MQPLRRDGRQGGDPHLRHSKVSNSSNLTARLVAEDPPLPNQPHRSPSSSTVKIVGPSRTRTTRVGTDRMAEVGRHYPLPVQRPVSLPRLLPTRRHPLLRATNLLRHQRTARRLYRSTYTTQESHSSCRRSSQRNTKPPTRNDIRWHYHPAAREGTVSPRYYLPTLPRRPTRMRMDNNRVRRSCRIIDMRTRSVDRWPASRADIASINLNRVADFE